jgi:hypothetical protein
MNFEITQLDPTEDCADLWEKAYLRAEQKLQRDPDYLEVRAEFLGISYPVPEDLYLEAE